MKEIVKTKGKAYLIQRPHLEHYPFILGVQGTAYEMGYQQGFLLAELIRKTASGFLTPIYAQFGGWLPASGKVPTFSQINQGRSLLKSVYDSYFAVQLKNQAPELLEELIGIAEGVKDAGIAVPVEDILIGNCIPEITELQFFQSKDQETNGKTLESKGCSDCVVWGKNTRDGRLLHGTNYDYSTFGVLHKGFGIVVANPESGSAFLAQCLAGTVGFYRGMNEEGMTIGETTSDSADRDLVNNGRIPHAMHLRKLLQYSANIQDAKDIMASFIGTTGYTHTVADSKAKNAVSIESSCTQLGVIEPSPDQEALWCTNHFVGYPGFNGYQGKNLVQGQMEFWNISWDRVDTLEKWHKETKLITDQKTFSWQRNKKIEENINRYSGRIDIEEIVKILRDWPLSRPVGDSIKLAENSPQLYDLSGPIVDYKLASIFSAVFDPDNQTAWVAVGAEPAQVGKYWPVDFSYHLSLLDNPSQLKEIAVINTTEGI